MIKNLNICGALTTVKGMAIDYEAHLCGHQIGQQIYSFELGARGELARLFSRGNQLNLEPAGVRHLCNGGICSETMFGMPADDFLKEEVVNRLSLFGGASGAKKLEFTALEERFESYEEIFSQGHLFCNYYFFIAFDDPQWSQATAPTLQTKILQIIGKKLIRAPQVADYRVGLASHLATVIHSWFATVDCSIFLLRLVRPQIRDFYLEMAKRLISEPTVLLDRDHFFSQTAPMGLDRELSERLRLDLAYKNIVNRTIVDQYKSVVFQRTSTPKKMAQLHRLRTVCLRQNIPKEILQIIDQKAPTHEMDLYRTEPTYIQDARQILEERVLKYQRPALATESSKPALQTEQLRTLLLGKFMAEREGSRSFERLLLDYGHRVDQTKDETLQLLMKQVIQLVHAYEGLQQAFSSLLFVDQATLSDKALVSLRHAFRLLTQLSIDDVNRFLVMPILENCYATYYGKEKLSLVLLTLESEEPSADLVPLAIERLAGVLSKEYAYQVLDRFIRENIKIFYLDYNRPEERESLRRRISLQLQQEGKLQKDLPSEVFELVMKHLHMESIYLNQVLPEIILSGEWGNRLDFMRSSALDQNRIEQIERAYCKRNQLHEDYLQQLMEREHNRRRSAVELEM